MGQKHIRLRLGIVLLSALCLGSLQTPAEAAVSKKNGPKKLPKWSSVEQVVSRHLAAQSDYQQGDLITQSKIEPVFEQLRRLGWVVQDRRAILRNVLADNDFVAKSLSNKSGKKFMRRIATYPGGYDRLYRLAAISGGRKIVTDLVQGPGGEKMIKYLATSKGGENMGKMLGNTPKGHDFNKSTGKIFTEKQFVEQLKQSYDYAQKTRQLANSK